MFLRVSVNSQLPTLKQALQSLLHGLQHLAEGTEADRAFAFVHIDQAVELLLKEKVRRLKESIYAGPDKTIGIFEARKMLQKLGVAVPEWSAIEIVHQQRNLIQHQGLIPDRDTATVYLGDILPFFEAFLKHEFGVDLRKAIGSSYFPRAPAAQEDKLLSTADQNVQKEPKLAIMAAATAVELVLRPLGQAPGRRPMPSMELARELRRRDFFDDHVMAGFQTGPVQGRRCARAAVQEGHAAARG